MQQLAFDLTQTPLEVPVVTAVPDDDVFVDVIAGDTELFALAPDWSQPPVMRVTSFLTATQWIGRYHYLGSLASHSIPYAMFCPDMMAMVAFGQPSNAHGVAKKYGLEAYRGNVEIVRVAVHPDAPANTASHVVAAACDVFHADSGMEWVFSYADTGQGHHGGIYQAVNAVYVGLSPAERGYLLDGEKIHPRSVVSRFGSRNPTHEALGTRTLERIDDLNAAKHTYIMPIGDAKSRRTIRKHLRPFVKPYPMRAPEDSEESRPASSGEGQVRSLVGASNGNGAERWPTDDEIPF